MSSHDTRLLMPNVNLGTIWERQSSCYKNIMLPHFLQYVFKLNNQIQCAYMCMHTHIAVHNETIQGTRAVKEKFGETWEIAEEQKNKMLTTHSVMQIKRLIIKGSSLE